MVVLCMKFEVKWEMVKGRIPKDLAKMENLGKLVDPFITNTDFTFDKEELKLCWFRIH